jgi:hypothetical protein
LDRCAIVPLGSAGERLCCALRSSGHLPYTLCFPPAFPLVFTSRRPIYCGRSNMRQNMCGTSALPGSDLWSHCNVPPSSHTSLCTIRIAVCYHAFFFGFFYLLFSVALVFQLAWSRPLTPCACSLLIAPACRVRQTAMCVCAAKVTRHHPFHLSRALLFAEAAAALCRLLVHPQ